MDIVGYVFDVFFFLDLIITFMAAYYDDEFRLVDDRATIACDYLKGWFLIDVIAIIPYNDIIMLTVKGDSSTHASGNSMVRILRLAKLNKLIKLSRLIRIFKLFKENSKIF